jgi:hypothetical protein
MNPKLLLGIALILSGGLFLTGCAHDRFAITNDASRIYERHSFVADVTCTSAESVFYNNFRDQFHMLAMPPRVRWTASFRIDRVIKGDLLTNSFRIDGAQNKATPFSMMGFDGSEFFFQTNVVYRVGFDCIIKGEVRDLEILTNNI